MANAIEIEFNKYGCKLGDTIEVSLIGNHEIKVIFTITSDVIETLKVHFDHLISLGSSPLL
jgi:hypothetical protein